MVLKKNYKPHMVFVTASITLLMAVFIYRNYLVGNSLIMYSVSDGFSQFLPIYKDFVQKLQEGGGLAFWNFSNGFGAIQSYLRFFYPTNLIPVLAGAFFSEKAMIICVAWMQVLKMVLAAVFMHLFLKKLKFNDFVCCNMGVVYAFCGILIMRGHWWILGDECYLAMFILWAAECFFQEQKWHFVPISIALLASCLGVYYIYLYALELIIYGTIRYIYSKKTFKGYFKFIFTCGGLFLLGVLMMSGLLVDSARVMLDTARYSSTTDYAKTFSLFEIADIKVLLSAALSFFDINTNGVFHMYTGVLNYLERPMFYCGLGCLFLMPQGFLMAEKKTRKLMLTGVLMASLYMLFPVVTDVFNLFIKNEELGLRSYRLSSLWIVIMCIVIAAYGLQCIIVKGTFVKKCVAFIGIILLGTFFVCTRVALQTGIVLDYNVCRWIILFLIAWIILGVFVNYKTESQMIRAGTYLVLIGITIVEMGHSARTTINVSSVVANEFYNYMQTDGLGYYGDVPETIQFIKKYDEGVYRIAGVRPGLSPYCSPLYFGIFDSSYYANINSKTYEFLNEVYPESFLANLGTKYSVGVGENLYLSTLTGYKYLLKISDSEKEVPYGYELLKSVGNIEVYENTLNLEIGIAYDCYINKSDFEKYNDEEQQKILLYSVVLEDSSNRGIRQVSSDEIDKILLEDEHSVYRNSAMNRSKDKFNIESWKEDKIIGNIEVAQDSVLVFSIPHVQGWNIYVDGNAMDIETGNIGFMSVELGKGEHRIELRYTPRFLTLSFVISVMAAMTYIVLVVKYKKHSRIDDREIIIKQNVYGGKNHDTI